jgi:hypothetical protein
MSKSSYTPDGFPSDLPRINEVPSAAGSGPVTVTRNGMTVTTQGVATVKVETNEEVSARAKSTRVVKPEGSKAKLTVKTF